MSGTSITRLAVRRRASAFDEDEATGNVVVLVVGGVGLGGGGAIGPEVGGPIGMGDVGTPAGLEVVFDVFGLELEGSIGLELGDAIGLEKVGTAGLEVDVAGNGLELEGAIGRIGLKVLGIAGMEVVGNVIGLVAGDGLELEGAIGSDVEGKLGTDDASSMEKNAIVEVSLVEYATMSPLEATLVSRPSTARRNSKIGVYGSASILYTLIANSLLLASTPTTNRLSSLFTAQVTARSDATSERSTEVPSVKGSWAVNAPFAVYMTVVNPTYTALTNGKFAGPRAKSNPKLLVTRKSRTWVGPVPSPPKVTIMVPNRGVSAKSVESAARSALMRTTSGCPITLGSATFKKRGVSSITPVWTL